MGEHSEGVPLYIEEPSDGLSREKPAAVPSSRVYIGNIGGEPVGGKDMGENPGEDDFGVLEIPMRDEDKDDSK
ncbi:MAG: hypothetical protein AUJ37_00390 [Candidatus Magasanikbacteria bacterium CG1_02_41_34]|uniref:Uncharacterized protein n=1 Tax=Candidatus Magasanikbacteria bacterium CG_4_10_14_0_2_um_filter_41_31 TaxID=1974639 RepID=A0A2M7V2L5_9BACT|nr:MAG: hypothetical protein AUJ37_00390 [Candidatus Magasanikbacteria bacterium CG1_02_41_34]PIZ92694.1 MAG: hypothetical protein COX83_03735 [Candidatus Magasanikbacteria bacterium CG_4_10_14_0_2_um_filter_41_31]